MKDKCPGCGDEANHFRAAPNGGLWACECGSVWGSIAGLDFQLLKDRHDDQTDIRVVFATGRHVAEMAIENGTQLALYVDGVEDIDPAAPFTPQSQVYTKEL